MTRRKVILTLFCQVVMAVPILTCCGNGNASELESAEEDVEYSYTGSYNGVQYHCFVAGADEVKMRLHDDIGEPILSLGNLKRIVGENGDSLMFAMNGGMYTGDSMPVGLYVENGEAISPMAKLYGDGNFNMRYGREASNGVFTISRNGHAMVVKSQDTVAVDSMMFATQSGPLLLYDGVINPIFNPESPNRLRRNGIGVTDDGMVVMVMADGITFYELASVFKEDFGCRNAMYLDGVVSKMYIRNGGVQELSGGAFGVIIYVTDKK